MATNCSKYSLVVIVILVQVHQFIVSAWVSIITFINHQFYNFSLKNSFNLFFYFQLTNASCFLFSLLSFDFIIFCFLNSICLCLIYFAKFFGMLLSGFAKTKFNNFLSILSNLFILQHKSINLRKEPWQDFFMKLCFNSTSKQIYISKTLQSNFPHS